MPYKIVPVNIGRGDQFTAEFLKMNPNHRMPVMVDHEPNGGGEPIGVFESGAIMMYLAEKAGKFWPQDVRGQVRGQPVGDLADGQPGAEDRRVRPFPPARRQARATSPTRSRRFTDEANRLYGVLNNRLYDRTLSGRRRVHDRRHDLLSLDGELEGRRARTSRSSSTSSAGSRSWARGPPCSKGMAVGADLSTDAAKLPPRSRPASARCSTTSAPGR